MVYSMTAFARQGASGDWGAVTWELRSVNHRYLEVALRLPEDLRGIEARAREHIAAHLKRGKVDASLRYQSPAVSESDISIDTKLLHALSAAAESIRTTTPGCGHIDPVALLKWPGVVDREPPDAEAITKEVLQLLDLALDELVATRAREGEQLQAVMEQRIEQAGERVGQLRTDLPRIKDDIQARLTKRLAELEVEVEPGRMEQELGLILAKSDVAEELDRLDAHVLEAGRVLRQDEPAGRRLDFLMQEMNREANTIASKATHIDSTDAALALKLLVEQMREQVQNIE